MDEELTKKKAALETWENDISERETQIREREDDAERKAAELGAMKSAQRDDNELEKQSLRERFVDSSSSAAFDVHLQSGGSPSDQPSHTRQSN